ncbi:MAG: hypothetical protein JXC85_03525 [Candidatus Aenigmarchaeota archaeon]|nr:hypothetical protein [Candidatus Aenigmarchaeota archaeon]
MKDFYVTKDPTDTDFGTGYLHCKLRDDGTGPVSIFDLKERFPFGIVGKAQAIHDESVNFFNLMRKEDIPTHYLGNLGNRRMRVYVAHIPPKTGWEDWCKNRGKKPFLVPIEVVVTNTITPVASLHKRLRSGAMKPSEAGLSRIPEKDEVVELREPLITTSTKLGEHDVYRDDLFDIVGLTPDKRSEIQKIAKAANEAARDYAMNVGLHLADGKFEFIMGSDDRIYIADTFLTSDENRLLAQANDGSWVDMSKQFLRNLYTITGYREKLEEQQEADPPVPFEQWTLPEKLDSMALGTVTDASSVLHQQLCKKDRGMNPMSTATRVRNTLEGYMEIYRRDVTGKKL